MSLYNGNRHRRSSSLRGAQYRKTSQRRLSHSMMSLIRPTNSSCGLHEPCTRTLSADVESRLPLDSKTPSPTESTVGVEFDKSGELPKSSCISQSYSSQLLLSGDYVNNSTGIAINIIPESSAEDLAGDLCRSSSDLQSVCVVETSDSEHRQQDTESHASKTSQESNILVTNL